MPKEPVAKNAPKKMSPYNMFMKSELAKVKETNAGISHKDAFKLAAQNWAKSADNPKNKSAEKKQEEKPAAAPAEEEKKTEEKPAEEKTEEKPAAAEEEKKEEEKTE